MGGPSAALVLDDLAELGVRRAVRVGTCVGLAASQSLGDLLLVREALTAGGGGASLGATAGTTVGPDRTLTEGLASELGGDCQLALVASVDFHPPVTDPGALASDMQTATLLARAATLKIALAALLIVSERDDGAQLEKQDLEELEKRAGRAAGSVLSG
jgi:uridine phosphorylase